MTVPSSGEISLGKIRQELESTSTSNDYNEGPYTSAATSLSASETGVYDTINSGSENRPDGVAPFKMSEWHGYGHNIGWSVDWGAKFRSMPNGYLLLSGSKAQENTAPNYTVADQQVVTFDVNNPASGLISRPGGGAWDNTSDEPRVNTAYVYISHGHANSGVGTYVDSGSVSIALGWGTDPGVTGTALGIDGKTSGSGWILTERKGGTDNADADFLDLNPSAPANNPPFLLNVARITYRPQPGQLSQSFYVRMAYSGSGDNTYGATADPDNFGIPGTFHSRSIHVINGQYSSSQDFKTTIVS